MKKSAVKSYLALVVIAGIFLTVIALILHYSSLGPLMPSFNFLNGRKPVAHIRDNGKTQYSTQYSMTRDIYSFEADFNDVFPCANKELLALGYKDRTNHVSAPWGRNYLLLNGRHEQIWVAVYKKYKLSVYSTPESSDYSSPDRHEFHLQNGWVSVTVSIEVIPRRIRFYSWLYGIINRLRP
jgi:hypothetical protein